MFFFFFFFYSHLNSLPSTYLEMATTRAKTGNARPRVFAAVEEAVTGKKSTKANTSKPRAQKVTTGRVEKKKAPVVKAAPAKKTTTVKKSPAKKVADKVEGKAKKAAGKVEGKPEKKAAGTTKAKSTTTKKVAAPRAKRTAA